MVIILLIPFEYAHAQQSYYNKFHLSTYQHPGLSTEPGPRFPTNLVHGKPRPKLHNTNELIYLPGTCPGSVTPLRV